MKILHITNDYFGSKVYMNLIHELDLLGVQQIIYSPLRNKGDLGKNKINFITSGSKIIYSRILNYHLDRMFYQFKIKKIYRDIKKRISLSEVDLIHAHTWYSDGGVSFLINRDFKIPYLVAIRSSDVDIFYKFLPHQRKLGKKIILKAKKLIFISQAYNSKFSQLKSISPIYAFLKEKIETIPNGIDDFWIKNYQEKKTHLSTDTINIIYIGTFLKRKNILSLQRAIIQINKNHNRRIILQLIGEGGNEHKEVIRLYRKNSDIMIYHGRINDKEKIMKILRGCDIFAMPSRRETFGLVYIEAMLQGLPVIYTKNDGIDGLYFEKIGEKIDQHADDSEIIEAMNNLIENYTSYNIPTQKLIENHDWGKIAIKYKSIYDEIWR